MALTPKSGGTDFPIVPAGMHKARLIRVVDQGTQEVHYNDETHHKHKIFMLWELPECLIEEEGEFKGKPFTAALFPTLSLHKKSVLRPLLVSWRGKDFTQEEEDTFNVLDLLDETFTLNIIHNESGGTTYANIAAMMPLAAKHCPARVNDLVAFDLSEFDQKVFDGLSEKMQAKIKLSDEWEFRFNGGGGEIERADANAKTEPDVTEDEIPFSLPDNEMPDDTQPKTDPTDFDFEHAFKELPKKTWTAVNELCKRKMGVSDYNDFYSVGEWGNPKTDTYSPEVQAQICKELITVCKARE